MKTNPHKALSTTMARLTALVALLMTGNFSPSYAANCEANLKPLYKCTSTFEDGGTVDYCLATSNVVIPNDGIFSLVADSTYYAGCTCETKGRPPDPRFGASSKDFFCSDNGTGTTSIGKLTGNKINGQVFNTTAGLLGLRSVFTCEAVAACP